MHTALVEYAKDIPPGTGKALFLHGTLLLQLGDVEEAIECFDKAASYLEVRGGSFGTLSADGGLTLADVHHSQTQSRFLHAMYGGTKDPDGCWFMHKNDVRMTLLNEVVDLCQRVLATTTNPTLQTSILYTKACAHFYLGCCPIDPSQYYPTPSELQTLLDHTNLAIATALLSELVANEDFESHSEALLMIARCHALSGQMTLAEDARDKYYALVENPIRIHFTNRFYDLFWPLPQPLPTHRLGYLGGGLHIFETHTFTAHNGVITACSS